LTCAARSISTCRLRGIIENHAVQLPLQWQPKVAGRGREGASEKSTKMEIVANRFWWVDWKKASE